MDNEDDRGSLYDWIVGRNSNTNEGLGRLLALVAVLIVGLGTLFWALPH